MSELTLEQIKEKLDIDICIASAANGTANKLKDIMFNPYRSIFIVRTWDNGIETENECTCDVHAMQAYNDFDIGA